MASWITRLIRPGDLVVVAGGVGEPTPLLRRLLAEAPDGIEVFVGLSHSDVLGEAVSLPLLSFGALGALSRPPNRDRVRVLAYSYDDLPRVLADRGRSS